jgi:hypothetical protein
MLDGDGGGRGEGIWKERKGKEREEVDSVDSLVRGRNE